MNVQTVEHVLSALSGMGVDNAIIEMDANEPPIGDGSAQPYVELIKKAGVVPQDAPRRVFEVSEPIHLETKAARMTIVLRMRASAFRARRSDRRAASRSFIPRRSRPRFTRRKSRRRGPLFSTRT